MSDWEANFVAPVLKSAGDYPAVFLTILARRAEANPDLIPIFAKALGEMAAWYQAEAAGLDAVRHLRRLSKAESGAA